MNTGDWIGVVGIGITISGAFYALIRSDINGIMDRKISKLKEDLQNEKILSLIKQNDELRERVNNTK